MHRPKVNLSSKSYLLRSMFFVPGHVDHYFEKIDNISADAFILDVEDSVPQNFKLKSRTNIQNYLRTGKLKGKQIVIRVNELDKGVLLNDLDFVLHQDVLAIMPAKIYSKQDMAFFDEVLNQYEAKLSLQKGHFKLIPLIETLLAFENINEIANSTSRLIALAFGGEDYLKELGGSHGVDDHTFDYPRTKIAIASKAAGLQAIDTPYLDVNNLNGFKDREQKSRDLGFEGCLLIHPKQIEMANQCFSPSKGEYNRALEISKAVKKSIEEGKSVALLDGVLIGPPMQKNALNIISKQKLIKKNHAE